MSIELLNIDCMDYLGVNLVGCEIDKEYFTKAKSRFEDETRQCALFCATAEDSV